MEGEESSEDDKSGLREHVNVKCEDSEHEVDGDSRYPSLNWWAALGVESPELLAAVLYSRGYLETRLLSIFSQSNNGAHRLDVGIQLLGVKKLSFCQAPPKPREFNGCGVPSVKP